MDHAIGAAEKNFAIPCGSRVKDWSARFERPRLFACSRIHCVQRAGQKAEETDVSPGSLYASGLIAAGGIIGLLGIAVKLAETWEWIPVGAVAWGSALTPRVYPASAPRRAAPAPRPRRAGAPHGFLPGQPPWTLR